MDELKEELNELIAKNEEAEKSLNELFADRQRIEEETRDVERQIEVEKAKNMAALSELVNSFIFHLEIKLQETFQQFRLFFF